MMASCKDENTVQPSQTPNNYSAFVDIKTAEIVAKNAYKSSNTFKNSNKASRIESIPQREILSSHTITSPDRKAAAYAFNYKDGGWAIISADKHFMPILAYNETGTYSETNKNNGVLLWEAEMKDNIQEARRTNPTYPDAVTIEWQTLICLPDPDPSPEKQGGITTERCYQDNELISYAEVQPFLTTQWDQGCVYNENCPIIAGNDRCNRAWAGCVAIAQAQVMFHYRQPTNRYQWANMPVPGGVLNDMSPRNPAVATLIREIGGDVEMSYGGDGSSADTEDIVSSLKGTYGYASADWVDYTYDPIRQNLRYRQPVILRGRQKTFLGISYDGHAWVTDGFQEAVYPTYMLVRLHMNWGWGSREDGWYTNWNPSPYNFQYGKKAIINIRP